MNQDPNQSISQDPVTLHESVVPPSYVVSEPVMSHKPSKLAMWTLIVNIINYGLPVLVAVLYFAGIFTGVIDLSDMGVGILLTLGTFAFLGLMSFVNVATLVLDIVYLVKGKPKGKAKVWVIISLVVYGLLSLVGLGVSIYLIFQQPYWISI